MPVAPPHRHALFLLPTFTTLLAHLALLSSTHAATPQLLAGDDWITGRDITLFDGILSPHLHLDTTFGTASRPQEELATGHHDPIRRDGFTFQNLEFTLSGRLGEHHAFFATLAGPIDDRDRFRPIFEEAFWKLQELPGGFEARLGRFYNRFGIQNTYHPHGFDWVDQYLASSRAFGDDSLTTIGAELTWRLPTPWTSQIDLAAGASPGPDDDAHGGDDFHSPRYNPEEGFYAKDRAQYVLNWTNLYQPTDFHQFRAGLSSAFGENLSGLRTQIHGAHLEYQWRENGLEPGGRFLRARSEAMIRRFRVEDELSEGATPEAQREFGCYTSVTYGLPSGLELGLRGEYLDGNSETGTEARFRVSPAVTWYANQEHTLRLRLQYNYDRGHERGDDHALWAQISLSWGGPEVR